MKALTTTRLRRFVTTLAILFAASTASQTAVLTAAEASRVRILIVVDMTGKDSEKQRRAKNRDLVRKALEQGLTEQGLQKRYTLDVIQGKNATPQGVLNYYKNLKTSSSETLFCYINCHGGGDEKRRHYMVLGQKKLFHYKLRAAMQEKNPRLAVLVTDSCYTLPGNKTAVAQLKPTASTKQTSGKQSQPGLVLRQLLFHHRGLVDIQSAKTGNLAKGTPANGNMFTRAFTEMLRQPVSRFDRNGDGFVEWSEFYSSVRRETIRIRNDQNQPPLAFSLAKKAG